MIMCFASCEKDKSNDGKSVQKLVKSIIEYSDYPSVTAFEYDENGRVVSAKWTENGNTFTIADVAYKGNMIIETTDGGCYESSPNDTLLQFKEEIIHFLDEDGYVIKTVYKDYWSDESYNRYDAVTYEYENGRLVKIEDGSDSYTFQWRDNDIRTVSFNGGTENHTYSNTFSNTVDNLNVDFFADWGCTGMLGIGSRATLKFKGTTSEHLPQMFDGDVFSYELDSDGYVKTVKVDGEPFYYIEYVE